MTVPITIDEVMRKALGAYESGLSVIIESTDGRFLHGQETWERRDALPEFKDPVHRWSRRHGVRCLPKLPRDSRTRAAELVEATEGRGKHMKTDCYKPDEYGGMITASFPDIVTWRLIEAASDIAKIGFPIRIIASDSDEKQIGELTIDRPSDRFISLELKDSMELHWIDLQFIEMTTGRILRARIFRNVSGDLCGGVERYFGAWDDGRTMEDEKSVSFIQNPQTRRATP